MYENKAREKMNEMINTLRETLGNLVTATQPLRDTLEKDGYKENRHNTLSPGDSYCIHRIVTAIGHAQIASLDAAKTGLDMQISHLKEMVDMFDE